jgi:hypothetical protein
MPALYATRPLDRKPQKPEVIFLQPLSGRRHRLRGCWKSANLLEQAEPVDMEPRLGNLASSEPIGLPGPDGYLLAGRWQAL